MKYVLLPVLLASLIVLASPYPANAQVVAPTCILIVTTRGTTTFVQGSQEIPYSAGDSVQIAWGSSGATSASNSVTSGGLSGFITDVPTSTKTYMFNFTNGSAQTSCSITVHSGSSDSIDSESLITNDTKPRLRGTSTEYERVVIEVRREGETKMLFKSKTIRVHNNAWSSRVTKSLKDGIYTVTVLGKDGTKLRTVATGQLRVGEQAEATSNASFRVGTVPLLSGGEARRGTSVPVSYLQITNVGKEEGVLNGFWLKQNGSADMRAVIGLAVVDDKGGSRGYAGGVEGSTPFKNGVAFAPTRAVFLPGERKLFTIKAAISSNVSSYLGSTVTLSVTSVDSNGTARGSYPISGTTWYIAN